VNGSINIGDDAQINGECSTVNGSIKVGSDATVESLTTVNGGIHVGGGTVVDKDVVAVNGSITMDSGSQASEVNNINGRIKLHGAQVTGDISTVNGDVDLKDGSRVGGDIIIQDSKGNNHRDAPLKITLDGDSVVEGSIIVEADFEVEVHLRNGGRVMGRIEGAEVIKK
jgi:DUF4097 and DUF4098 domain-containing protein YvlB